MSKQVHTYTGKLIYDDFGLYQLILSPTNIVNISSLLDLIYHTDSYLELKIMSGSKTLFNEQGSLIIKKDTEGIFGYHINGENLDKVLFYNTNNQLDIEIYSKALEGVSNTYGTEQTK
jgi:hypothetical protein